LLKKFCRGIFPTVLYVKVGAGGASAWRGLNSNKLFWREKINMRKFLLHELDSE